MMSVRHGVCHVKLAGTFAVASVEMGCGSR